MRFCGKGKRIVRAILPAFMLALVVALSTSACKKGPKDDIGLDAYYADFESAEEIKNWKCSDDGKWAIEDGKLVGEVEQLRTTLWLDRVLANDLLIEFEAECLKSANDINCFIHGNGKDYSGYEVIIGGFDNQFIAIYKSRVDGDDRERDRMERADFQIEKDRVYSIKIRKRGNTIQLYVDDDLVLAATDKEPIRDPEHRYFGLSTFVNKVRFDNLKIEKKD